MNRDALNKLKRVDIQKLAKRDGVKANGTTAGMIDNLLRKHHPLLVPYMDSIPPTSEREAISRKMMRRQRIFPMAPGFESASIRRSPRKVAVTEGYDQLATDAAAAGGSNDTIPRGREPDNQDIIMEDAAQIIEVSESASSAPINGVIGDDDARVKATLEIPTSSNHMGESEQPADGIEEDAQALEVAESTSWAPINGPIGGGDTQLQVTERGQMSKHDGGVSMQPAVFAVHTSDAGHILQPALAHGNHLNPATHHSQPIVAHTMGTQPSLASFIAGQPNVATLFGEPIGTAPLGPTRSPLSRPPRVFFPPTLSQRAAMEERAARMQAVAPAAERPTQYPRVVHNGLRTPTGPRLRGVVRPVVGGASRTTPPPPAVHPLSLSEVRATMLRLAPTAEKNAYVRERLRELKIVVGAVEHNVAEVRRKTQKVQKLRIALERHVLSSMKSDPRLLNGTWTREGPAGHTPDEDDSLQELDEVEEMTSREVLECDLP